MKKTFSTTIGTLTTVILIVFSLACNPIPSANAANPADNWQLTVTGLVGNPLSLSGAEILAMPKTVVNASLICVDFPGSIVLDGNWTGVKLKSLIEMANPSAGVIKVAFFADDGYSTDLTIETAMRDDIILAYENNGEALSSLRLVVPGKWGYKWISQLTNINLVDHNFLGHWESQGYSDVANISEGAPTAGALQQLLPERPANSPPATSPSPSPSEPPTTVQPTEQPATTPTATENQPLPNEAVYAIVIAVILGIIGFGTIFVRKRRQ
jgi:DMSO/TMAO reductase YedYZ molybdopterin-dependent catalytic subunit